MSGHRLYKKAFVLQKHNTVDGCYKTKCSKSTPHFNPTLIVIINFFPFEVWFVTLGLLRNTEPITISAASLTSYWSNNSFNKKRFRNISSSPLKINLQNKKWFNWKFPACFRIRTLRCSLPKTRKETNNLLVLDFGMYLENHPGEYRRIFQLRLELIFARCHLNGRGEKLARFVGWPNFENLDKKTKNCKLLVIDWGLVNKNRTAAK